MRTTSFYLQTPKRVIAISKKTAMALIEDYKLAQKFNIFHCEHSIVTKYYAESFDIWEISLQVE